jgi:hypothetical protein
MPPNEQNAIEMMDDSKRAANHANFKVNRQQLIDLIECYRQRKYVEDIEYIQTTLKGIPALLEALDVNPTTGISSKDLKIRD